MKRIDYRPEAQMWAEISEKIGDKNTAGLTQDYGSRLAYWGWKNLTSWPTYGDLIYHDDLRGAQNDFEQQFESIASKKELFLVTDFDELNRQPLLKENCEAYPIFAEGDGYVIYDLRRWIYIKCRMKKNFFSIVVLLLYDRDACFFGGNRLSGHVYPLHGG